MRLLAILAVSATVGGLALSVAWRRFDPINAPLAIPESPKPKQPPRLRYQGDALGFVGTSHVMPVLTDRGRVALITLANADGILAYPGPQSPFTTAFRNLLREPERRAAFRELSRFPNGPSAAFGLAGLYLIDPAAFASEAFLLEGSPAPVWTQHGCIGREISVADLVGCAGPDRLCIGSGVWPNDLGEAAGYPFR